MPFGGLPTRLDEHPAADRYDQPGVLGEGDELVRRDETAGGVLPADEGLDPSDGVRVEIEDGLVGEEELVRSDGNAQVGLKLEALADDCLHLGGEQHGAVLPRALGLVEGDIGVAEQLVGAVSHPDRDPDADPGPHGQPLGSAQHERRSQDLAYPRGDDLGSGVE